MNVLPERDPQILREIEGEYVRAIKRHERRESDRNSLHVSEVARGLALNDALRKAHTYELSTEEIARVSEYLNKLIIPISK